MGAAEERKKSVEGGAEEIVALAREMGVSPRRLTGWEPATVTTHIYEGDRLVKAVTVREPEFTPNDLALLRGHLEESRVVRGRHGQPMAEATDRRANPQLPREYGYEAIPVVDFAQQALDQAEREYRSQNGEIPDGLTWVVRKVPLTQNH